jgi:spermidine synthase
MLGFAAGGVVAPLRAMGFDSPLVAIDLSRAAEELFRETCGEWAGTVRFVEGEASSWLRRQRRDWDFLLEDLTVPHPGGAIKPAVSVEVLPELMHERLAAHGVVATNVLPVPGLSWDALLERLASPHRRALVVECEDYENRILLAGPGVPLARQAGNRLRTALRRIGSRQDGRFEVGRLD